MIDKSQSLVEFNNYTFKYRAQAEPSLIDINLEIKKGEKIVIVGPSGSGKSTLAKSLNGQIPNTIVHYRRFLSLLACRLLPFLVFQIGGYGILHVLRYRELLPLF